MALPTKTAAMRKIEGRDFPALTAGRLREFLNAEANRDPGFDDALVHFLDMEDDTDENDPTARYATHVEMDAFDQEDGGMVDHPQVVWCVSLLREPNREKRMEERRAAAAEKKP